MLGKEAVDIAAEVFEDDFGDVGREDDAEACVDDVPSHDVPGVAIEGAARGEDLRHARQRCGGELGEDGFGAGEDDGRAAIAEDSGGDEVGDGLIIILPGEGAEFDREQKRELVREGAEIVGGAGDAGGSSDAAEAEDGGALDVGGERHQVDEAGVDGGGSDAGHRREEDG